MMASLLAWKPLRRLPTLRGFAAVRLGESLKISDIAIHAGNGRRWVMMPSRVLFNGNTVQLDERGKVRHVRVLEWLDPEAEAEFANAVLAALEREHPGCTSAE